MINNNQKEIVQVYRFREFIDKMNAETPNNNYSRAYKPRYGFCDITWNEALKQAKYGIKDQYKIEKIVANMSLLETIKTKGFGMAETGLCVDVGTYLNGEPECWIAEQFDYKPKKVVKLLINTTCSEWGNSSQQIANRGAGIISLIQMLKKQDYIVKINLYGGIEYCWKKYICFLKISSNPLDIQSLSYALCSSSLLRRFMLAWLEYMTDKNDCSDHGYGRPCSVNEVSISKDIIHFAGLNYEACEYNSEKETKKYILKTFDKFLKLNHETRLQDE